MVPIEQKEVRGLTMKQIVTSVIAIIGFVVALVVRDIRRENQVETLRTKVEALETITKAAENDRTSLKTVDNTQNERLTKIETRLDYQK